MTVPSAPQIEAGLMNTAGELFVNFELFGRYLTAILAGVRAPLALATISIGKDLFVSNGITQGPDVLQGFMARIEASRVNLVRGQALAYVNRTIFIDGVTYNRTSGCDDYAFYDSSDRTHSIQITSVSGMAYGEAETNVGHIRY